MLFLTDISWEKIVSYRLLFELDYLEGSERYRIEQRPVVGWRIASGCATAGEISEVRGSMYKLFLIVLCNVSYF